MPEPWEAIKNAIMESLKESTGSFLEKNANVKELVAERARRMGQLAQLYATASPDGRASIERDMKVVRQAMENDLAAAAVNASAEAHAAFSRMAGVAFSAITKALPGILSAL